MNQRLMLHFCCGWFLAFTVYQNAGNAMKKGVVSMIINLKTKTERPNKNTHAHRKAFVVVMHNMPTTMTHPKT